MVRDGLQPTSCLSSVTMLPLTAAHLLQVNCLLLNFILTSRLALFKFQQFLIGHWTMKMYMM